MKITNMFQVLSYSILTLIIITAKSEEIEVRHLTQYCNEISPKFVNLELQPGSLVLVYDESGDNFFDAGLECHLNLTALKKSPDQTANFAYDVTIDHINFNEDELYETDFVRFQGLQVNHQYDFDEMLCCKPFADKHIGKFVKLQITINFAKSPFDPFSQRSTKITIKTDDPIGEINAKNLMIVSISVIASLITIISIIVYRLECRRRRPRRDLLQDEQRDLARLRPNNSHTNYGAVQLSNEQLVE